MTGNPAPDASVETEAAVAAWLLAHPDFLARHTDVLAKLHIPHASAGVVSLIERQVAVLREQLNAERGRLNHLVARAREYESFSNRLHELTVKLILARDLAEAGLALEASLRAEFSAAAVALKLFPLDPDERATDPVLRDFIEFVDRDRCLCGPLDPPRAALLFGADAPAVRSAALIPIRGHEQTGVLAIGSEDAKRFAPDMGTDLLDRLGEIISARLSDLAHRRGR